MRFVYLQSVKKQIKLNCRGWFAYTSYRKTTVSCFVFLLWSVFMFCLTLFWKTEGLVSCFIVSLLR